LVKDPDFKNSKLISCHSNSKKKILLWPLTNKPPFKLMEQQQQQQQPMETQDNSINSTNLSSKLGPGVAKTTSGQYLVNDPINLQQARQNAAALGVNPAKVVQAPSIVDPASIEGFNDLSRDEQQRAYTNVHSENHQLRDALFKLVDQRAQEKKAEQQADLEKKQQQMQTQIAELTPQCNKIIQSLERSGIMSTIKDKDQRQAVMNTMANKMVTDDYSAGLIFSIHKNFEEEQKKRKRAEVQLKQFEQAMKQNNAMQQAGIQLPMPGFGSEISAHSARHNNNNNNNNNNNYIPSCADPNTVKNDIFTSLARNFKTTHPVPVNSYVQHASTYDVPSNSLDKRHRIINPSQDALISLHSHAKAIANMANPPTRQDIATGLLERSMNGVGQPPTYFKTNNLFVVNPELASQLFSDYHSSDMVETNSSANIYGNTKLTEDPDAPIWCSTNPRYAVCHAPIETKWWIGRN